MDRQFLTAGLSDSQKVLLNLLSDQCHWWLVRHIVAISQGVDIAQAQAKAHGDVEPPDVCIDLTAHVVRYQRHVTAEGAVYVVASGDKS